MISLSKYIKAESFDIQLIIHEYNELYNKDINESYRTGSITRGVSNFFKKLFSKIKNYFTTKKYTKENDWSFDANYRDNTVEISRNNLEELFIKNAKPTQMAELFPYVNELTTKNKAKYGNTFELIKTIINKEVSPIAIVLYTKKNAKEILKKHFDEDHVDKLNKPAVGIVEFSKMVADKKTRLKVFDFISRKFADPFVFFGEEKQITDIYKQQLTEEQEHFYIFKHKN